MSSVFPYDGTSNIFDNLCDKKELTLHDIGNLSDILIIYTEKANI